MSDRTPFCHTWLGIAFQFLQVVLLAYYAYHMLSAH
jgi:hypothetical protein